jgi:hypothetical protein
LLSAAGLRFLGILSRPGIPPLLRPPYRTARTTHHERPHVAIHLKSAFDS